MKPESYNLIFHLSSEIETEEEPDRYKTAPAVR